MKDGGLLRGTISELVAGETVTIVTVTGKTREFPMKEVEYAGPAERDPAGTASTSTPPASGAATPPEQGSPDEPSDVSGETDSKAQPYIVREGKGARLHLTSTPPGLTFHRQTGSAMAVGSGGAAFATGYERLCTAPCDIKLPAGTEVLALSEGNEPPRQAEPLTFPAGQSQVVGSFESRAGTRAAGWLILGGSLVVGGVMLYSAFDSKQVCSEDYGFGSSCHEEREMSIPLMLGGVLIPSIGIPVGVMLGVQRDKAKVELAKGTRASVASHLPEPGLTLHGTL